MTVDVEPVLMKTLLRLTTIGTFENWAVKAADEVVMVEEKSAAAHRDDWTRWQLQ